MRLVELQRFHGHTQSTPVFVNPELVERLEPLTLLDATEKRAGTDVTFTSGRSIAVVGGPAEVSATLAMREDTK